MRSMAFKDPEAKRAYLRRYYLEHRDQQIDAAKAWKAANPDRARAIARASYARRGITYRAAHRDAINAKQRAYDAANPEKVRADNRTQRLRRYGLTVADYGEMMARQEELCALCKKAETHKGRDGEVTRLAVDHDHATGSVRALLCHACNVGLGSFLDDPALLEVAAGYVRSFRG